MDLDPHISDPTEVGPTIKKPFPTPVPPEVVPKKVVAAADESLWSYFDARVQHKKKKIGNVFAKLCHSSDDPSLDQELCRLCERCELTKRSS